MRRRERRRKVHAGRVPPGGRRRGRAILLRFKHASRALREGQTGEPRLHGVWPALRDRCRWRGRLCHSRARLRFHIRPALRGRRGRRLRARPRSARGLRGRGFELRFVVRRDCCWSLRRKRACLLRLVWPGGEGAMRRPRDSLLPRRSAAILCVQRRRLPKVRFEQEWRTLRALE